MLSQTFDIAACAAALGKDANAFLLNALAECDSTNTQLMRQAEAGAPSGTVIVTGRQTAGRGRLGRVWISSPSTSLTFSLLWRFSAESSAPEALSLAIGLGLQRALAALGVTAAVKWPNDILCGGRKLAGVLIEVQPGDIKSAVIGIGINLRLPADMPAEIAGSATSLDATLSRPPAREQLLAVLLAHLAATLRCYQTEGFAGLRDEWQARHAYHGHHVRMIGGSEIVEGICSGVTERGELLIKTSQGTRHIITGDVSLRPT